MNNSNILEIKNLQKMFGGIRATNNLSLDVKENELKGIIGPNGAGKTTFFNLISGYYQPDGGNIFYKSDDITYMKPDKVVQKGIGRTFQKIRIMENTKVLDYLKTAFFTNISYSFIDILFKTNKFVQEENELKERSMNLLNIFGIAELADKKMNQLSYGEQRRASICRALALKPDLLLLDEPTAGLNIGETKEIVDLVLEVKEKFNLTVIIIEHDMKVIMRICDQIAAISEGSVMAEGTPVEIQNNEEVIKSYLGE